MDVADPRALRELLRRHDIRAATSLGQRFLVDRAVLSAIVDAADLSADDDVLEVGPGPGVLTAALATRVRSVTAVEVDPRMVALLEETLAEYKNVRVVQADALKVDLLGLAAPRLTRIVANLPYQITTPLLERFLAGARVSPRAPGGFRDRRPPDAAATCVRAARAGAVPPTRVRRLPASPQAAALGARSRGGTRSGARHRCSSSLRH